MRLRREIVVRVAVAVVALPIVGTLLVVAPHGPAALFGAAGAVAAYEYYRLTPLRGTAIRWPAICAAAALPALPLEVSASWPAVALAIVAAVSAITWIALLLFGPRGDAPLRAGHVLGGLAFVGTGLVALAALRARPDGLAWSATVLIATWANDTGAFFGGHLLGRHHVFVPVSPGKTWEGLVAGAATGIAAALVARLGFTALSLADALAVGGIAAVLGPLGDLCKSMVKRAAGVKDSGRLFLAHGGMLDRIDAVLLDAPGVLAYVIARVWMR